MTCWANRHMFVWGSSSATDALPLSLRCDCGAMTREDIRPISALQAELDQVRGLLGVSEGIADALVEDSRRLRAEIARLRMALGER